MFADDIVLCGDDETDMTRVLGDMEEGIRGERDEDQQTTQFMDFNFGQDNGQE